MLSKPWDWTKTDDIIWETPAPMFYYYKERWSGLQFKDVLDLGCGKGRHAVAFAKAGFNVSACDLSEIAVAITKETAIANNVNVDVSLCDILSLPYCDNSFDAVFSYHVVSHTDSIGVKKAVKEIARVLRTGGEIYFDLVSKHSLMFQRATEFVDKNTFIMHEIPAEFGLPHYCVDYEDIAPLLSEFKILDITLRYRHNLETGERFGGHYFVHAIKI